MPIREASSELPTTDLALTPDPALIERIQSEIDLNDRAAILTFGLEAQKDVASYADTILRGTMAKDAGKVGELLSEVLSKVDALDPGALASGWLIGRLIGAARRLARFRERFRSVAGHIDRIALELERHHDGLRRDIAMLDGLHDRNVEHLRRLEAYIAAGTQIAAEAAAVHIPRAEARVAEAGEGAAGQMAAQQLADLRQTADRLERKLHDLKLSRVIALQTLPQIRLIQSGDAALAEKLQSSIAMTIPAWKNQATIALALHRQDEALKLQRKVAKTTNELLTANAEKLRVGMVGIERETQRGMVDVETLAQVNREFIDTLNDVLSVQREGRARRLAAETEMRRIEDELKRALAASETV